MFAFLGKPVKKFKEFAFDDRGAITADWVVLTAGTIGLAILTYTTFGYSEDEIYDIDPEVNGVDFVVLYIMEQEDPSMAPKRSVVDNITRTIRAKAMIFQACIGFGLTYQGYTIGQGENASAWCDYL